VPVGSRALRWVEKYLDDVRPLLLVRSEEQSLFLTGYGEAFNNDVLSRRVIEYFRWRGSAARRARTCCGTPCATHLLEGARHPVHPAAARHEKLETTAIYTEVSIMQLQAVHARCHPAERPRAREVASRSRVRPSTLPQDRRSARSEASPLAVQGAPSRAMQPAAWRAAVAPVPVAGVPVKKPGVRVCGPMPPARPCSGSPAPASGLPVTAARVKPLHSARPIRGLLSDVALRSRPLQERAAAKERKNPCGKGRARRAPLAPLLHNRRLCKLSPGLRALHPGSSSGNLRTPVRPEGLPTRAEAVAPSRLLQRAAGAAPSLPCLKNSG